MNMASKSEIQTLSRDYAVAISHMQQCNQISVRDLRKGTQLTFSPAFNTLKTGFAKLSITKESLRRLEDYLDRAPTLGYRGIP